MTVSAAWIMLYIGPSVEVFAFVYADCLAKQFTFKILCYSLTKLKHILTYINNKPIID